MFHLNPRVSRRNSFLFPIIKLSYSQIPDTLNNLKNCNEINAIVMKIVGFLARVIVSKQTFKRKIFSRNTAHIELVA